MDAKLKNGQDTEEENVMRSDGWSSPRNYEVEDENEAELGLNSHLSQHNLQQLENDAFKIEKIKKNIKKS